jgi:UDP-glucose 4-epimerase
MSRILVTGGAGFIGSHVADALIARGHDVHVLDDLSGGFRENVPSAAAFTHGSVADAEAVDRLFARSRFTHVYHLAAYAAEGLSHFIKRFNYTNNVIGSVNLLNASIRSGVELFVFASSIAVYGTCTELPITEAAHADPEDSYGIAKHAIELELRACRTMFGLDSIVFRPHNVFGPRQNIGDRYRNVIGIFMNQILQGQPMTIFGDGTQTRAFSYIADVAPLMAEAIDVPAARNHVFNIGADRPYSLNELARAVAAAMHVAPDVVHLPRRAEVHHAYSTHDKIRSVFGERPQTSLDDGLEAMAAWVRRHGARESEPFRGIEILKNLPASWQLG